METTHARRSWAETTEQSSEEKRDGVKNMGNAPSWEEPMVSWEWLAGAA